VTKALLGANPGFYTAPRLVFGHYDDDRIYVSNMSSNQLVLTVKSGALPAIAVGDVLEYHNDRIPRIVTATRNSGTFTVTFSPAVTNTPSLWDNKVFCDWGSSFGSLDTRLTNTSPAIDAGCFLTTVASASGSGTSFAVADSHYFNPGWGSGTSHPVLGDLLQLQAQTARARITGITNNTITVDTALTWTNGQGVALAYSGSAPDIGADEYSNMGAAGSSVSPPNALHVKPPGE
jgi:hypothetical protein